MRILMPPGAKATKPIPGSRTVWLNRGGEGEGDPLARRCREQLCFRDDAFFGRSVGTQNAGQKSATLVCRWLDFLDYISARKRAHIYGQMRMGESQIG